MDGIVTCRKCNGSGVDENVSDFIRVTFCTHCYGLGKITWLENIFGVPNFEESEGWEKILHTNANVFRNKVKNNPPSDTKLSFTVDIETTDLKYLDSSGIKFQGLTSTKNITNDKEEIEVLKSIYSVTNGRWLPSVMLYNTREDLL